MGEFVRLDRVEDLGPGEMMAVEVDGNTIGVANVQGTLYAFDDTCTHAACSLADGDLDGTVVTCPCHLGEFDVTTGEVLGGPPTEAVATYPIREADDGFEAGL